jgi:hypothetical protein
MKKVKVSAFVIALMLLPLSTSLYSQASCTRGETTFSDGGNRRGTVWHCNDGDYMTISVKQPDGTWKPVYDEPIQ